MSEIIFLKTATFGGYDKKDVDEHLKTLYSQIYELKNELSETKSALEKYKNGTEEEKVHESILADERAKMAEIQSENHIMSEKIQILEADNEEKTEEISLLKETVSELEENLSDANTKISSLKTEDDVTALSIVFAELKKSAEIIVNKAKKEASKLEENSKKLVESIIADANEKASAIVAEADKKSKQMEVASGNMKALMLDDVKKINEKFLSLKQLFDEFQKSGADMLEKSGNMLSETKNVLESDGVPVFHIPENFQSEPVYENYNYDDSGFIDDLDSVNILSDNFMDEDSGENLERELMEFESGGRSTQSLSLEEIAKQAEAIDDSNNIKKTEPLSLEEIAKQAEAINDSNNVKNTEPLSLEEIAKQAEALN